MALINCPECGKEISDQAKNCPNCGYVIKKSSLGVKKIVVPVVIVLGIIVLLFLLKGIINPNSNGLYNGIKWGSSVDEVTEIFEKKDIETIYDSSSNALYCYLDSSKPYEGIDGLEPMVVCQFKKDELNSVKVYLYVTKKCEYDGDELYEELERKFNKLYGEDNISEDMGFAITWEAKEGNVQLVNWKDNTIAISYDEP